MEEGDEGTQPESLEAIRAHSGGGGDVLSCLASLVSAGWQR